MLGLDSLFSWVPPLIEWLVGFVPHFARLHMHEGAVRISGVKVVELKHGFFVWCPHFSEVYTAGVKRRVVDLPEQLLTTSDSRRVRVGGVLVYHVSNCLTWLVENEDPEHGLATDAARVLREWIKTHSFAEIQEYSPDKRREDKLTRLAQEELGVDFGVRIRHLALGSFAETDATDLHHSGSMPNGAGLVHRQEEEE